MKKSRLLVFFIAAGAILVSQDIQHETKAVNIEIPVRVFDGGRFIDNLKLDDFEVLEDGRPQKIEAVYLVKGTDIARRQETRPFAPDTARNFFLFFEIANITGPIVDTVNYFVRTVLVPGDVLTVVTPLKTYRMKTEAFEVVSKDRVASQLMAILRRDVLIGYSEYRDAVEDLAGLAKSMAASITQNSVDSIAMVQGIDSFSGGGYVPARRPLVG